MSARPGRVSTAAAGLPRRAVAGFRTVDVERKVAAVAALLLLASTFGPFSFVEAAEVLLALAVLALLLARAERRSFELPFGDGTLIAAAGVWAGALIAARLFDRPLGQNLLALVCAAILFLAGARLRATATPPPREPPARRPRPAPRPGGPAPASGARAEGSRLATEPLPPPEFEPYRPQAGEQLRLRPAESPDESES